MENEKPNIFQRINAVMQSVEYVKKDLKVQNYSAVSHDNVTASVRKKMVENGIVLTVSQSAEQFDEREANSKMRLYHGTYTVRFTNMDDKIDFVDVSVSAHAYDNGDKAPGKCMSYATKYALLKTFMIETGENEESRNYDAGDQQITATELTELQSLLIKAGKTSEYLIEYLNKKGAKIEKLDQLNVSMAGFSKSLLLNAIKQVEKSNDTKS